MMNGIPFAFSGGWIYKNKQNDYGGNRTIWHVLLA